MNRYPEASELHTRDWEQKFTINKIPALCFLNMKHYLYKDKYDSYQANKGVSNFNMTKITIIFVIIPEPKEW